MSESVPKPRVSFEERCKLAAARRREFEPELSHLATLAIDAYASLRPRADHVGQPDSGNPLRHQQVYGMSDTGDVGGEVADYLLIRMGEHHYLNLYHNLTNDRPFKWQLTRSLLVGDLLSEQTKVNSLHYPRYINPDTNLEVEVSTYRYPEVVGRNPMFVQDLCNWYTYEGAEGFIRAFETDLDQALSQYS